MKISISPKIIFRSLLWIVVFLVLGNIIAIILRFYPEQFGCNRCDQLFDFNTERSIPTYFSSFILIASSLLLYFISVKIEKESRFMFHWKGLSFLFLFLAIDELASIHELLVIPLRNLFELSDIFYYSWVIPYTLVAGLIFLLYVKFFKQLPKATLLLFLLAGSIFITGAVVLEMIGGLQHSIHGVYNLTYCILYTFEELFEMLGVIIFINALLLFIMNKTNSVIIVIKSEN